MDTDLALTTRRTVHDYASDPVDEDALMRALKAALAAPNHRMTEPWRFVRVGPRTRVQLADLAVFAKAQKGPLTEAAAARVRARVMTPPELVVVIQMRSDDPTISREDYAAVACAIQNLSLSLWASGIGAKWSTGSVTSLRQTYELLGVDPLTAEICGFVWIGRPAFETPKARRRKAIGELLRVLP